MTTPTTKAPESASRRSRFPLLRDFRVRSKLGLILAVPITAIVTLSAINLVDSGQRAVTADTVHSLANLIAESANLVHHLQSERTAAASLLIGTGDQSSYKTQYSGTDLAIDTYRQRRNTLGELNPAVTGQLTVIEESLSGLTSLRGEVSKGKDSVDSMSIGAAVFRYDMLIGNLLKCRDIVWQSGDDSRVTDEVRAAAAFSHSKEYVAKEQTIVLGSESQASPAQFREYLVALAGQQEALNEFLSAAPQKQRDLVKNLVRGQAIQDVEQMESQLNEAMSVKPIQIPTSTWLRATTSKLEQMRVAEQKLDEMAVQTAGTSLNTVRRQVIIEVSLVIATLLAAVVLTLVVARSMIRSLRQLREAAIGVAYEGLPKAVARLRDPEVAGQANPATIATELDDPLPVHGRDEFGQVAQAFNVVHREAVRIAAEQAVLRANVSTMFVNLARRSQSLVDRLIGHLDRLEKGEEDPDRLAALFQLDHLATRMRRNDENLLVLAGADSSRVQREPAPLGDVLRAAQSEVEHYTRVEFGVIERDTEIAPHAVNDLVHLIAELFDNATAFSPPDTAVVVDARRVGERVVLRVEDRGIGVPPDQLTGLNERLANPPTVDVAVSRMMGLVVVARLAHRHAIRVELQSALDRGTVAYVYISDEVLAGPAARGNSRNSQAALPTPSASLALDNVPATRNVGAVFDEVPAIPETTVVDPPFVSAQSSEAARTASTKPAPAWHDLTGATRPANSSVEFASSESVQQNFNLPTRTPGAAIEPTGELTVTSAQEASIPDVEAIDDGGNQVIPRQRPSSAEAHSTEANSRTTTMPVITPPTMSPHAPPTPPGQSASTQEPSSIEYEAGAPVVASFPTTVSSAGVKPAAPGPAPGPESVPAPAGRPGIANDEAADLLIFQEMESVWFDTGHKPLGESNSPELWSFESKFSDTQQLPVVEAPSRTAQEMSAVEVPADSLPTQQPSADDERWQTVADHGWQAATAASAPAAAEVTGTGLPKRVPMAQLVPGGVALEGATLDKRSPEAVRGLLSAYHRGVQRGRQRPGRGQGDVKDDGRAVLRDTQSTPNGTGREQKA
ncbi:MAG: nitrate- and nitrite sensing domain-containing protein [Longispora sp.]|nr:nitrate- and nitrite sensing domain-containing protein [Longispora sp. (in: high G+C Gram-positive bacteria)]